MSELSPRVSDADRERAVHVLRDHLVEGRLTLAEFTQPVDAALRAVTADDLAATAESLPAVTAPAAPRRASKITAGLFSHTVRRGRLRLPRRTFVLSAFSDVDKGRYGDVIKAVRAQQRELPATVTLNR